MNIMLAAVVKGIKQVALEEVPKPILQNPTDVILKVTATAICTSDVHIVDGYFPPSPPFIMGHEFIGIVEEVGNDVKMFKLGDRVAAPPAPYCGVCENCRKGHYGQCMNSAIFGSGSNWGNLPGGMAEFVRIPHAESSLVTIPDQISDEQAIFAGDMLTTGYFAVDNCALKPGDTVAVFGAGPVGLCAIQTARLFAPSKIILVDILTNRLQTGLTMGATHVINSTEQDAVTKIMEITNGQGVNAAIEAIGLPATVNTAAQVIGVGGIFSIVGLFPGNIDFPIQTLLLKNITVKVGLASLGNMRRLMSLITDKKLDTSPLITKGYLSTVFA
ncbi:MAG TPA: alcohol dehydrogenase [Desulfosporosinus sp.]|nr:alcohol dehydrogenase [Desulfosporosinus sp.]